MHAFQREPCIEPDLSRMNANRWTDRLLAEEVQRKGGRGTRSQSLRQRQRSLLDADLTGSGLRLAAGKELRQQPAARWRWSRRP
jgi:hypothetical protein